MEKIAARSASTLMFGTNLLLTRAGRPFQASDIALVQEVLGDTLASAALHDNAAEFYRLSALVSTIHLPAA